MDGHDGHEFLSFRETGAWYECFDQEEKMDALWEDLDEKFPRNSGKIHVKKGEVLAAAAAASPGREVHMRCVNVRALKLSKANGQKTNVFVFIKELKKIFVLHNSRRTIKKRAW